MKSRAMKTSEVHLNRPVAQTCPSAGSRDIPDPCFWLAASWRLESRRNPQAGKPALRRRSIGAYCLHAIAFIAIGSLLTGCGRHPSQIVPPPPVVTVIQPIAREVVEWDEYTGRLESPETVDVRARVSGYLDKVHFKDGAR